VLKLPILRVSFDEILLEAMDEGLMELGESSRAIVYFYVERNLSLKKVEIPKRLEDFSAAIRKVFGMGGLVMEELILKKLCEKLNVYYESVKNSEFHVAIEKAKKSLAGPK